VCFKFGFSEDHIQPLLNLAFADWHQRHEDVAMAFQKLKAPSSVPALAHLAEWVPKYLEFDGARALSIKAIWALGAVNDASARRELEHLALSESNVVSEAARTQLQRSQ
jgi:hypothetical protein